MGKPLRSDAGNLLLGLSNLMHLPDSSESSLLPGARKDKAWSPLYQQIKDRLQARIRSGEFVAGSQLPSEKELCEKYKVSRITVRKSLELLETEGTVKSVQGKGSFVIRIPEIVRSSVNLSSAPHIRREFEFCCCVPSIVARPWQTADFQREFEKEFPGITLTVSDSYEFLPEPWRAYEQADLYALPSYYYREAQRRGLVGDWLEILGPSRYREILDDIPDALISALGREAMRGLIPVLYTPLIFIYNKRLFEAAGVAFPRFYWSENDFLATCEKLKACGETTGFVPFLCDFSNIRRWPFAIAREGGRLWNENGDRCLLDSPASLRGIHFYKKLIADLKYGKAHVMPDGLPDYSLFLRDRVAIQPASSRTLENLETDGHLDWGIASIPEGTVRANPCNEISLAISPNLRDAELATDFMSFVRQPQYMSRFATGNYSMLVASRRGMREFLSGPISEQARGDMEAMIRSAYEFAPQEYVDSLARGNLLKQLIHHVYLDFSHLEDQCRDICNEINQILAPV